MILASLWLPRHLLRNEETPIWDQGLICAPDQLERKLIQINPARDTLDELLTVVNNRHCCGAMLAI